MLVESPDGSEALLGRSHKVPAAMRTCLSGFIDQCESIEEARFPSTADARLVARARAARACHAIRHTYPLVLTPQC
jgi:hypothetical protein